MRSSLTKPIWSVFEKRSSFPLAISSFLSQPLSLPSSSSSFGSVTFTVCHSGTDNFLKHVYFRLVNGTKWSHCCHCLHNNFFSTHFLVEHEKMATYLTALSEWTLSSFPDIIFENTRRYGTCNVLLAPKTMMRCKSKSAMEFFFSLQTFIWLNWPNDSHQRGFDITFIYFISNVMELFGVLQSESSFIIIFHNRYEWCDSWQRLKRFSHSEVTYRFAACSWNVSQEFKSWLKVNVEPF